MPKCCNPYTNFMTWVAPPLVFCPLPLPLLNTCSSIFYVAVKGRHATDEGGRLVWLLVTSYHKVTSSAIKYFLNFRLYTKMTQGLLRLFWLFSGHVIYCSCLFFYIKWCIKSVTLIRCSYFVLRHAPWKSVPKCFSHNFNLTTKNIKK